MVEGFHQIRLLRYSPVAWILELASRFGYCVTCQFICFVVYSAYSALAACRFAVRFTCRFACRFACACHFACRFACHLSFACVFACRFTSLVASLVTLLVSSLVALRVVSLVASLVTSIGSSLLVPIWRRQMPVKCPRFEEAFQLLCKWSDLGPSHRSRCVARASSVLAACRTDFESNVIKELKELRNRLVPLT